MRLLKPLAALLVVIVALTSGAIVSTGAPLFQTPGILYRVSSYLTTNGVETVPASVFPERELTSYYRPVDQVFGAALASARSLGWQIRQSAEDQKTFEAIARTPVWGFKDRIRVRVERTEQKASALHFRGQARLGVADFGQNTARLINFRAEVERRLKGE